MAARPDPYREVVLERDSFPLGGPACYRCAARVDTGIPLSVHHLKLKGQGGPDTPDNRITTCGSGTTRCHGWIHMHVAQSMAKGWLRSASTDDDELAETPVWCEPRQTYVLLNRDGTTRLWESVRIP